MTSSNHSNPPGPRIHQRILERVEKVLDHLQQQLSEHLDAVVVVSVTKRKTPKRSKKTRSLFDKAEQSPFNKEPVLYVSKEEWASNLSLPLTVDRGLEAIRSHKNQLVRTVSREIELIADSCMDKKTMNQALCRPFITNEWPWPDHLAAGKAIQALVSVLETPPAEEFPRWTTDPYLRCNPRAALLDVAQWARKGLNTLDSKLGDRFFSGIKSREPLRLLLEDSKESTICQIPPSGIALLYLAEKEVKEGLSRKTIAVDAGKPHHDLFRGWQGTNRGHKNSGSIKGKYVSIPGHVELFDGTQNKRIQLTIPSKNGSLQEGVIKALRDVMSPEGFRHWAGLLLLMSKQGGRRGWVRWTMKDHLEALGYKGRVPRNAQRLDKIAHAIELFTKLELTIYEASGTIRARSPLVHIGTRYEKLEGSRWLLDGMELRMNPFLYEGVRNVETGKIGNQWFPVPEELAQIDHVRHPNAIPLALLMAIRWHWDLFNVNERKDHLALKGKNLLELTVVDLVERRQKRQWEQVEKELNQLQVIGLLERWEWDDSPRTVEGLCRFYPAQWLLDRSIRKLQPNEEPPLNIPHTGKEFQTWRLGQNWTQTRAAEELGLSRKTVGRVEKFLDKKLTPKVFESLKNHLENGPIEAFGKHHEDDQNSQNGVPVSL